MVQKRTPSEETEEQEETQAGLQVVTAPIGKPDEGFDFIDVATAALKEAGYVTSKAQTKEIVKYLDSLALFDAFENGEHKIQGIGALISDVKAPSTRTATFDMKSGVSKGETYETKAKHVIKLKTSGALTSTLAEVSELAGWAPADFLNED